MKRFMFLLTLTFIISFFNNAVFASTITENSSVKVNGNEIMFRSYLPQNSDAKPLIVISHGTSAATSKNFSLYMFDEQAKFLANQGYNVVFVLRSGYGTSGGSPAQQSDTNQQNYYESQSVLSVINIMKTNPAIDKDKIILMGQSGGGLLSVYLAAKNTPGVIGVVNFVGGLKNSSNPNWDTDLAKLYQKYGESTKINELWVYGSKDNEFFPLNDSTMFATSFNKKGEKAKLIIVNSGHSYFQQKSNIDDWWKYVSAYFKELGILTESSSS